MSDDPRIAVLLRALEGAEVDDLRQQIAGLENRDRNLLYSAMRRVMAAIHDVPVTELDDLRADLARRSGTSSFASDKGDYEWGHKHRDSVLIDALRGALIHPEASAELAAIALTAVQSDDERYYSF